MSDSGDTIKVTGATASGEHVVAEARVPRQSKSWATAIPLVSLLTGLVGVAYAAGVIATKLELVQKTVEEMGTAFQEYTKASSAATRELENRMNRHEAQSDLRPVLDRLVRSEERRR